MPSAEISEAQEKKIFSLYRSGLKQIEIIRQTGATRYQVRKVTDPKWYESYAINKKLKYVKSSDRMKREKPTDSYYNPLYDPKRDGKVFHDNMFAYSFGDPLPGRSALDQMKQK